MMDQVARPNGADVACVISPIAATVASGPVTPKLSLAR